MHDAGIPIAMGTDNMFEQMAGDVEHKELAFYVEAGLTPMQAIVLAMFSWAWTGLFRVDTATGQPVQSGIKKGNRVIIQRQLKELIYKK